MTARTGPTRQPRPLRMLLATAAWGSCFVVITWGQPDAPALWFAALRTLLAGLALLGASRLPTRRGPAAAPRGARTWLLIVLLALTNVTAAFAAMFIAATGLNAGVASVLANAQPLLIILPAWWLFGERPRTAQVLAIAAGFGGLTLVAAPAGGGRGAGLALLAALAITIGTLLARSLTAVNLLMLGVWQFLLGGAALAILALAIEGPPTHIEWTFRFVAAVVALALVGTALPYVVWLAELRRATLTAVTAWTLLVPVVGVVLGILVLRQGVGLAEGMGDAVVVAALFVLVGPTRRRHRATHTDQSDTNSSDAATTADLQAFDDRADPVPGVARVTQCVTGT